MIISRYIVRNIIRGTLMALAVLVSLSLLFVFIGEMDDVGRGNYGLLQAVEYVALLGPGKVVEFIPLAILLGAILSLGALAGNSEIIAMQAAGVSTARILLASFQAAALIALLGFLLSEFVAPLSEASAKETRSSAINATAALRVKKGLWVKDGGQVLYIRQLLPNGVARSIEIFQLDEQGRLSASLTADSAIPINNQWHLKHVVKSTIGHRSVDTETIDEMIYDGNISHQLLNALLIKPRQMSTGDLYAYVDFLHQNNLDAKVERLSLWQKVLAPIAVFVMCFLAIPFVLGSQRQSNAGQRLMLGILLGLAYVVANRLLVQLGVQLDVSPVLNALAPNLLFFILANYLLFFRQSSLQS